jgi:rare lipoprotein A
MLRAVAVGAVLFGCATTSPVDAGTRGLVQEGRASFYARAFDGRKTASGERYRPSLMTAAHPTLPFGTWLRVTRPGGPSVDVRVNDRCGCGGGRIVDLSEAAARKLNMIRAGVVRVRLEVIRKPATKA